MFSSFDVAVQSLSRADSATPWTPGFPARLHQLPELTQTSDAYAGFIVVLKSSDEVIPQTT